MNEIKYFKINENQDYMLLASNEDIYFLYDQIRQKLSTIKGHDCIILVDLLYQNGFSFNRFIEIIFKNGESPHTRIINSDDISVEIKNNSINYFKENPSLLDSSVLAKSIKQKILQ